MYSPVVRKHRVVRIVAAVLYVLSALVLIAGIALAVLLAGNGFGYGWGAGSRVWVPIVVLPFVLIALFFLILGSMLLFLAGIENNMSLARSHLLARRKAAQQTAGITSAPTMAATLPPGGSPSEPVPTGPAPAAEPLASEAPQDHSLGLPESTSLPAPDSPVDSVAMPTAPEALPSIPEPGSEEKPLDMLPASLVAAPEVAAETPTLPQVEIGDYDEWGEDEAGEPLAGNEHPLDYGPELPEAEDMGPAATRPLPGAAEAARIAAEMEAIRNERQWQEALELRARIAANLASEQTSNETQGSSSSPGAQEGDATEESAPGNS